MNKIDVRNLIEDKKKQYYVNKNHMVMLEAAVLLGIYRGMGGTKLMVVPSYYNNVVTISKVFTLCKLRCDRDGVNKKTLDYVSKIIKINIPSIKEVNILSEDCIIRIRTTMLKYDDIKMLYNNLSYTDLAELCAGNIRHMQKPDLVINEREIYSNLLKYRAVFKED